MSGARSWDQSSPSLRALIWSRVLKTLTIHMMPVAPAYSGDLSSWLPQLDLVVASSTCSGISIVAPRLYSRFRRLSIRHLSESILPAPSPSPTSFRQHTKSDRLTQRLTTVPRVLGSEADFDPDLHRFAAVPHMILIMCGRT